MKAPLDPLTGEPCDKNLSGSGLAFRDDVYKRDGTVIAALLDQPRARPKSTAPEPALATSAATAKDATPAPRPVPAAPKPLPAVPPT